MLECGIVKRKVASCESHRMMSEIDDNSDAVVFCYSQRHGLEFIRKKIKASQHDVFQHWAEMGPIRIVAARSNLIQINQLLNNLISSHKPSGESLMAT